MGDVHVCVHEFLSRSSAIVFWPEQGKAEVGAVVTVRRSHDVDVDAGVNVNDRWDFELLLSGLLLDDLHKHCIQCLKNLILMIENLSLNYFDADREHEEVSEVVLARVLRLF